MKYKGIELESIQLKAVVDSIDDIVNHELMRFNDSEEYTYVVINSYTHQKHFNIMLVDFLSNLDGGVFRTSISCLRVLRNISENPHFEKDNSIHYLSEPVDTLKNWLEAVVTVDVWFPSVNVEACFNIRRIDFIKICGNICKHGLGRLTKTAKDLRKIFKNNGFEIDDEQSLLALEDFHEKFHEDILTYHLGHIAEMLNDIRWGVHQYLLPEFISSYHQTGIQHRPYSYTIPKEICSKFAKNSYWELMNLILIKPPVRQFTTYKTKRDHYE